MLKANAVMKKDVVCVKRDTLIFEAVTILVNRKFTGLPVVNEDMSLAGIISEKDILRFVATLDKLSLIGDLKDSIAKVEDFMTTELTAFDHEDKITDIYDCLVENNFRRVPIIADNKLVGIISRKDLITYLLESNIQ